LVESSEIDDNGNINLTSQYVYNKKGLCEEVNKFSDGQLAGVTEKNNTGDISSVTKYKRNSNNDIIELLGRIQKIQWNSKLLLPMNLINRVIGLNKYNYSMEKL
jgi:hypothetical protein